MSRPVLRIVGCRICAGLLSLALSLAAACGQGRDLAPERSPDPGERLVSDNLTLTVLPETYLAGGQATAIELSERLEAGELLVDISAVEAQDLQALFFRLEFDPQQFSPAGVESSATFGSPTESLKLQLSAHGELEYGEMRIRPGTSNVDRRGGGFNGSGLLATVRLRRQPQAVQRLSAAAPGSSASSSPLSLSPLLQLNWSYYSQGDYNQNGDVSVTDLTSIGLFFQQSVPEGQPNSIEAVVDGNGDGTVSLADLTPIGINFRARSASYNIYYSDDPADLPASSQAPNGPGAVKLDQLPFSAASGDSAAQRLTFSYQLESSNLGRNYWVRHNDAADGSGQDGTASSPVEDSGLFNLAPIASLGLDAYYGFYPLLVSFDLSACVDPDGQIVLYELDRLGDGSFELSWTSNPGIEDYTYNNPGIYKPVLRVTDNGGKQASRSIEVVVSDPANISPSPSFTLAPDSGEVPLEVNFDASASTDSDGVITHYEWDFDGDNQYDLDSGTDPTVSHTYVNAGSFTPRLRVSDDRGGRVTTISLPVTPTDSSNFAPLAQLTAQNTTGVRPLTVDFDASGCIDTDGEIVKYRWDWEGDGEVDAESSAPQISYTYYAKGDLQPSVRAVDNDTAESSADSVAVSLTQGWESVTLFGGVNIDETDIITVPGEQPFTLKPFVAYTQLDNNSLRVIRTDLEGKVIEDNNTVTDLANGEFAMATVSGRPAIAYNRAGTPGNGGVAFVRASDIEGTAWGNEVAIHLGGAAVAGDGLDLAVHSGEPVIAYGEADSLPLRFVRSGSTTGSIWGSQVEVINSSAGYSSPRLLFADGLSAVAVLDHTFNEPSFFRSQDPDGLTWSDRVSPAPHSQLYGLGAVMVDGNPALVYAASNSIVYQRASQPIGGAWGTAVEICGNSNNASTFEIDLVICDGRPAACFYRPFFGELTFVWASDALGSAWDPPEVVDSSGKAGKGCSMVAVGARPWIAYGVEDTEQLCLATLPPASE